jgi:hypothetical protein
VQHLAEGKAAAHVRVEDEKALRSPLQDDVAEVVEAAGRTQRLVLAEVFDRQARELLRRIFDEVAEDALLVVSDQVDLLNGLDFLNCGQAVPDDGVARNVEQRLQRESPRLATNRRGHDRDLNSLL